MPELVVIFDIKTAQGFKTYVKQLVGRRFQDWRQSRQAADRIIYEFSAQTDPPGGT
jgi:hypothetical protein